MTGGGGTCRATKGLADREASGGLGYPAPSATPTDAKGGPAGSALELWLRRPTAPQMVWSDHRPTKASPLPVPQGCVQQEMPSEALTRTLEDWQQSLIPPPQPGHFQKPPAGQGYTDNTSQA